MMTKSVRAVLAGPTVGPARGAARPPARIAISATVILLTLIPESLADRRLRLQFVPVDRPSRVR